MRTSALIIILLITFNGFSQRVKIEIADYNRVIDGVHYSTFQFANADYSYSRPTLTIITNKQSLLTLWTLLPGYFKAKQEYTDIWILGLDNYNEKNPSETEVKIVDAFFESIIKYRHDNNLPLYEKSRLQKNVVVFAEPTQICNYIFCRKP